MVIKRKKCENCKKNINIPSDCTEFSCPNCNEKYVIDNNKIKAVGYTYDRFKVSIEEKDKILEELKLFHYEHISDGNKNENEDYVWIKVRRKEEFNNREEVLKLEEEYKRLIHKFDVTTNDMRAYFPFYLAIPVFFLLLFVLGWIPLIIYFNIDEYYGWVPFLVFFIIIVPISLFTSIFVQKRDFKKNKEYLISINKKINDIFKKLEELNKEDN